MAAKQTTRDRGAEPKARDGGNEHRYVTDWHRKSRADIVRDGITALGESLKKVTQPKTTGT